MELRIYEALGIKYWKRFLLWMMSHIYRGIDWILRRKDHNPKGINYNLSSLDLHGVKAFMKMLWMNGLTHTWTITGNLFTIIPDILSKEYASLPVAVICFFINLYCIMLQRYNYLRIKKVIKRYAVRK